MNKREGCISALAVSFAVWAVIWFCIMALQKADASEAAVWHGVVEICVTDGDYRECAPALSPRSYSSEVECEADLIARLERITARIHAERPRAQVFARYGCARAQTT